MTASKWRWINRLRVTALAVAMSCASAWGQDVAGTAPAPDAEQIVQQDLRRLAAKLNDPNARQEERDEAARRLISRRSPDGRRIVAEALSNLNPGGQLAAARALADDPEPDPALIDPLFATLGTNRQLTEAATRALAAYKSQPQVLARLIEYVERRPPAESTRIVVIRAIGSIPQKRSGEYLITLLNKADETLGVRAAAAEALADLSGLSFGNDQARWQQWWAENIGKSDAEFRSDLLGGRAGRDDLIRQHFNELATETANLLKEQYRATAPAQQPDALLRFLRSPEPQVRVIGAAIILEEALDRKPTAPVVLEQLREMVGDSSAAVRSAVADALGKINDDAAFEAMLAQIAQEPDAGVRASLA